MSSSSLFDRLLCTFIQVRHRLESLLQLCRIHVNPSSIDDDGDDCDETYRFYGPYHSDIQELETSIALISSLIENFQQEQNTSEDSRPFPNLPLCENGWTWRSIQQLEEEKEEDQTPITLNQLSFHVLNELDTTQSLSPHPQDSLMICDKDKNLLDLPPELLLHIFSYLSPFEQIIHLAPTCRFIANLVLTRLYSHLDLSKLMSVFHVSDLLSSLSSLRSITFTDWEHDVSILTWAIWFERISITTPHLHTIRFQNVLISPILICLILQSFSHSLQTIIFDYQQQKTYDKFDLILALLADPNIPLRHITASYHSGITNFGIAQLVQNLNVIIELNLLYIEAINDQTVDMLCSKHGEYLEILKIDGAQLTDQSLDYIAHCRKLKSIMIEFCTNMTGFNFQIFQNFSSLKELSLSKLTTIPLECFESLFDGKHIFEHLLVLKLGECHLIDDNCVLSIIDTCPRLIDFTCSWAYSLTDTSFKEIVTRCVHLERLSILGCHQIFGFCLIEVPEKYLRAIEYLNFEQCNLIGDELLLDLHRRKKSLAIINYYGSPVDDDDE